MKYVRLASPFFPLAGAVLVFAAVIAWQPDTTQAAHKKEPHANIADTTIPKSTHTDKIDIQLNLDSVMQQVNVELSKMDYAKMNADIQKAIAQIDYNKINLEVNKAIKQIDWKQMQMDVSKAVDSAKMAIDKIDWNEMKANINLAQDDAKKAMAEQQKLNTDTLRKQIQQSLQDAQKDLQKAQVELKKAQAELKKHQQLQAALEKDGLIEKGKAYRIELKDGMLYINGIKQSKVITDKYSRYYPDGKNFSINNDEGTEL